MMDFLEKLYSYEYFPQILFATIAILLILLVVVILFGKKDEKVRKEEETRRLELASLDTFAKEETTPTSLEINDLAVDTSIPEIVNEETNQTVGAMVENVEEPEIANEIHLEAEGLVNNALSNSISNNVVEELSEVNENISEATENTQTMENTESFMIPDFEIFKEEEKVVYQTSNIESEPEVPLSLSELHPKNEEAPMIKDIKDMDSVKENDLENTALLPEFNFDELASSISKELDEINKLQEQTTKISETEESSIPNQIDVTPIKEVTKFTPSSVFSSVYVNKAKEVSPVIEEPQAEQEGIKPILEEKTEEEIPVIRNIINEPTTEEKTEPVVTTVEEPVVKPVVTNPFIFDMPAKKEEKVETPKLEENTSNVNVPDFSSFQNETYDIK